MAELIKDAAQAFWSLYKYDMIHIFGVVLVTILIGILRMIVCERLKG